jgi:ribosome-associated protein
MNARPATSKPFSVHVARWMSDKIADAITVYNLRGLTSVADFFVICSAHSTTQSQAIADYILERAKGDYREAPIGVEGYDHGRWILIDFGATVTHIFCDEERRYYDIDGLWADAPTVHYEEASNETRAKSRRKP